MIRSAMTAAATTAPNPAPNRFADILVTRTIRAIEESGPLEDASELRDAARQGTTREEQVIARARALARRIGLQHDLERMRTMARLSVGLLALVVVWLTWLLVSTVFGEGRRINVVLAWIGVLGPSVSTLLVWLVAVMAPRSAGAGLLAEGLGGIALRLFSRPRWAGSHAPVLAREGMALVREAGLLPWAFGVINHAIWALAFVALTGVLYLMFAARAYELTWETTILPESSFVDFIRTTGQPAAMLGLPHADPVGLVPGAPSVSVHLAYWLMYCVLLYGLLPRLVLALVSRWKWSRGKAGLRLDMSEPYYRRLSQRFDQLAAPVIVDAERLHADAVHAPTMPGAAAVDGPPVWIAFELPPELSWRPGDGVATVDVPGDSDSRHALIDRLARSPAARAVVACNAASSPDRGTARFLRDVSSRVGAMALLLVVPEGHTNARAAVWTAWLRDAGLGQAPLFEQVADARRWLTSTAEPA